MRNRIRSYAVVSALVLSAPAGAAAQHYDPRTESPLTLLAAPKDPLAYYDARAKARALMDQDNAAAAEPLAEQITREYPQDGENWLLLAQAKYALKKHAEAAAAFEKAGRRLRWGGAVHSAAWAAIAHEAAGNKRAALDSLRRHVTEEGRLERAWIDENDFVSLQPDPEFQDLVGRPDATGWSRDYGWRRDLDFLRDEVKRVNAEYRGHPLSPEFERRYEELKQTIPALSDEQILVGMSRMLALLNQGHTNIVNTSASRLPPRALPLQLYVFPEGLFVAGAAEPHKTLIGSRLISIEGVPAEEVLRRINETQSVDGDNSYIWYGPSRLRMMAFLVGLGIAKSSGSVQAVLQSPGGPRKSITLASTTSPVELDLPPGVAPPLYLRERKQLHWHQPMPEHDALYLQLNGVGDEKDETLVQYALRLRTLLSQAAPDNLILDMRLNGGGSTHIYAEFLRTMIGYSMLPDRRLYVLTSRGTYSAAGNLITELEQLADATFVGEASSECCNFYGSPSQSVLPFSKLTIRQSSLRWNLSRKPNDFRRELHPHLPVVMTAKDHFAGRDPVLETVMRLIQRNKAMKLTQTQAPATAPAGP